MRLRENWWRGLAARASAHTTSQRRAAFLCLDACPPAFGTGAEAAQRRGACTRVCGGLFGLFGLLNEPGVALPQLVLRSWFMLCRSLLCGLCYNGPVFTFLSILRGED
jgi:hypothetical protein